MQTFQPPQKAQPQAVPQVSPQGSPSLQEEFKDFIDPNNPVQALLLDRLMSLQETDVQVLDDGISDEAAVVLKKVIPEVGFVIDFMMGMSAAAGSPPAPSAGQMPQPVAGTAPQPQAGKQAAPASRLSSV